MSKFDTLDYLAFGNPLQQKSYEVLTRFAVFDALIPFSPILVGTIPIDIAIENSDLDIACFWTNKNDFIKTVTSSFSHHLNFTISETIINQNETVLANFFIDRFEVEIFGQNVPVKEQMGYRHMLIEAKILKENDENFKNEIIRLKQNGIKTEPAFARLLNLKGDPYLALLDYFKLKKS
ncbi:DUF4269 domain-containing protein [Flavobacterium enshiense]|uniref:DUF4269 domain-containing protein n=1 Tax=Flavobacterium enshiense TaxID=1341165 RepID=UPI00345C73B2